MAWNIFLYTTNRNERPVKEFIKSLSPSLIAKISQTIDLLKECGSFLKMPHSKKIEDNLYELRIRGQQDIRIFYAFKNRNIYLLHAFQKQSRKTPRKEIRTALKRLRVLT